MMEDSIKLADGATLGYRVEGSGSDVLLVTGLGGTAAFWAPIVARLKDRFRVITTDARGIAGSTRGTVTVDIDRLSLDCFAILDAVGSKRVAIVGHSTGGVIAQTMGLMQPERISGLGLSGTWAKADTYMHGLFRSRLEVLRKLPQEYAVGTLFVGYPAGWLKDNWQAHDVALKAYPATKEAQDIVAERIAAILAFDRSAEIGRLKMPVLVNGAEDDQIVPAYLQRELAAAIPGAKLQMLQSGNHFYPLTRTAEFTEVLGGWLGRLDP
jgi:aminoacrylate hydrolase